jgi:hypothetical protein
VTGYLHITDMLDKEMIHISDGAEGGSRVYLTTQNCKQFKFMIWLFLEFSL